MYQFVSTVSKIHFYLKLIEGKFQHKFGFDFNISLRVSCFLKEKIFNNEDHESKEQYFYHR